MANFNFNRKQAYEKETVDLYATLTIGGTGAVTLTQGYGIASCTRVSQGLYRLTLSEKYASFKNLSPVVQSTTAEDITFQVKLETVATTKLVEFFTLTGGSVANPNSGDVIKLKITLKNTTLI